MKLSNTQLAVNTSTSTSLTFNPPRAPGVWTETEWTLNLGQVAASLYGRLVFLFKPNKEGRSKLRVRIGGELWLAKSHKEMAHELGWTLDQVRYAVKKLKRQGLIETKIKRWKCAPTVHYLLKTDQIPQQNQASIRENSHNGYGKSPESLTDATCRIYDIAQGTSSTTVSSTSDEKYPPTPTSGGGTDVHSRAGNEEEGGSVERIGPIVQAITRQVRKQQETRAPAKNPPSDPYPTNWNDVEKPQPSRPQPQGECRPGTRATGTNPRALGTNPRAVAARQQLEQRETRRTIDELQRLVKENEWRRRAGKEEVQLNTPRSGARVIDLVKAGMEFWAADQLVHGRDGTLPPEGLRRDGTEIRKGQT